MRKGDSVAQVDLQKLTPWQTHFRGVRGAKVMRDARLPLSTSIYHRLEWRYARLIFENSRLRLSPLLDWPDPYEAWWCGELFGRPRTPLHGINAYALCWTMSKFDEPAWRMVGYGRSEPIVRLRCTVQSLLESARESLGAQPGSWYIGRVRYRRTSRLRLLAGRLDQCDSSSAERKLKDVGRTAASLLIRKRKAFRFEEEVRLIFLDQQGSPPKTEIFLPVDRAMITDVMTSPYATNQRARVAQELAIFGRKPRRSLVLSRPRWMRGR